MVILDQKGQIWTKKVQIMALSEFSWTVHLLFLKEYVKSSSQNKNQENLQWLLENIGLKGSKLSILVQKVQKGPNYDPLRIFPDREPTFSDRAHQKQFLEQKPRKFIVAFGKYRPKRFKIIDFGPNLTILGHFGRSKKISTKKFFRRFLSLMKVQLCAKNKNKTRKFIAAFGKYRPKRLKNVNLAQM